MKSFWIKKTGPDHAGKKLASLEGRVADMEANFGRLCRAFTAFANEMPKTTLPESPVLREPGGKGREENPEGRIAPFVDATPASDLQAEQKQAAKIIARLEQENAALKSTAESLRKENAELAAIAQNLKDTIAAREAANSHLAERLARAEQEAANTREVWETVRHKAAEAADEAVAAKKAAAAAEQEKDRLRAMAVAAEKDAASVREQLEISRREVARLAAEALPGQKKLREIWLAIENLPQTEKQIASAYYELTSLPAFLAGAGQFARLEQLWDASAKKIREGQPLPAMPGFMALLLAIYQEANPDGKCACMTASIGGNYDYKTADRVGRNGTYVAAILLPGLALPNGGLSRKCLVSLK